jgi:hypothetical protein
MSGALSSDQLGRLAGALSEESLDELDQGTVTTEKDVLRDGEPASEDDPPVASLETPSESEAVMRTSVEAGERLLAAHSASSTD